MQLCQANFLQFFCSFVGARGELDFPVTLHDHFVDVAKNGMERCHFNAHRTNVAARLAVGLVRRAMIRLANDVAKSYLYHSLPPFHPSIRQLIFPDRKITASTATVTSFEMRQRRMRLRSLNEDDVKL